SNGQRSEQRTDILSVLHHPERFENRIGFLARPALADIAAEFAVDIRPLHRLTREAGNVVDLAADPLPIRQNWVMRVGTASPMRAVSSGSSTTVIFCMKARMRGS